MRILITNDDGINAPGLIPFARWAQKIGDVTVFAPKYEQSGKSHGIELHHPFEVKKHDLAPGIEAYSVDSSPADCVRVAILGLQQKFDMVFSGINRGLNIGYDIIYSGTVGAIFEAAALGVPAIAFSTTATFYSEAHKHLDSVYDYLLRNRLMEKSKLLNINIPDSPDGFRITRQGGPYYSDHFVPIGNDLYNPKGFEVFKASGSAEFDTDATLVNHHISISPLTIDRTDWNAYKAMLDT